MSSESTRSNPPLQTVLPITFIIVGGGIAGLSCAIALKRVGHTPIVLERRQRASVASYTGVRLPPNCTKILFHWGLRQAMYDNALPSHTMLFTEYGTGDYLGAQVFDEAFIKETRGMYMVAAHCSLYKVLYDAAMAAGIEVRMGAEVEEIDPDSPTVKLVSGEILTADVLVGADGEFGKARQVVAGEKAMGSRTGMALYDSSYGGTVIQKYVGEYAGETGWIFDKDNAVIGALGAGHAIISFPINTNGDYAFQWYGPDEDSNGHYGDPAEADIYSVAKPDEGALKMIMPLVKKAVRVSVRKHEDLDSWVAPDARLALIGEAAHPFPPATIQATAMAIEDGAVLAKIFSHLLERRQIVDFLEAYQEIRQPRVNYVHAQEHETMMITVADGEVAEIRNRTMRANTEAGKNVLEGDAEVATKQWSDMVEIFGYDCEDAADEWWMEWGILRERALSVGELPTGAVLDFSKMAVQVNSTVAEESL
ncbi:FAD/NAD-P-binding domain-containing protein [Lenzites betulinus]|nr:FAD/NAD-P-binding domain-containing protein [Lenzites betulinus]